jgi:hypothetical protein
MDVKTIKFSQNSQPDFINTLQIIFHLLNISILKINF